MKEETLRSGKFRMGRWRCYLYMLLHDASWLAWTALAVVVVITLAGFLYSPWAGIAALGVDLFVAVMAMSILILGYGFNSVTGVNMTEHLLASEDGKLIAEFEDGKQIEIEKSALKPYFIYPGGVMVPVEGSRKGWVWIPPKAFESDELYGDFLKSLYKDESNTK